MKKLRIVLLCAALLCTLSLFGCTRGITDKDIADNTYIYEGDGFGGDFSIALQKDGSANFIYLHIEDGERFLLTGKFSPSTETE